MMATYEFTPVTLEAPCDICGKPDWCRRSASGAHECHRVNRPIVDGYERITGTPAGFAVYRRPKASSARTPTKGRSSVGRGRRAAHANFAADNRKFQAALLSDRKHIIAAQLGVNVAALESLGIGYAEKHDLLSLRAGGAGWKEDYPSVVSSFPEYNATADLIGFCLRTDDGRKGSPAGKVGARRGLIIPSTLESRPDPVLLVEGPTDVAACETLGIASVGRPSNSSGGELIAQFLPNREVLIVGENDQKSSGDFPGRDGATKLATSLAETWDRPVSWTLPPGEHKDIRAYLQHQTSNGLKLDNQQACHDAGAQLVETLLAAAVEAEPPEPSSSGPKSDWSAAKAVLELCVAADDCLFHDDENRAFVHVATGGMPRTLAVRSQEYALLLGQRYFSTFGSALPSASRTEAVATLEGLAIFDGPEEAVFIRIGEHDDQIVLDLCDESGRVVVIDRRRWTVVNESPVRFRRTRGMLPLPAPVPGGAINDLRQFVNVASESDFILLCGFVIACFNPCGPFPALLVNGEAGSAKSTLCRIVRALIDPNKAPLRCDPKDNRDLAIAANNAWLIGLDNLSRVNERLSNALCRLATGGGFATRELYTNSEEVIFDAKRPVLINGIGEIADRGDLLDRAIRLSLPTIPESQRRTERAIWNEFREHLPAILGAILDTVCAALGNRDNINVTDVPRMADSAEWVVAAEPACPWEPGAYLAALSDQRRDADEFVIEASPLACAIRDRLERYRELRGTATELLGLLADGQDDTILKHALWPKSAPALGTRLKEVTPNLRRLGIEVETDRDAKRRSIRIYKTDAGPDLLSSQSRSSSESVESASQYPEQGTTLASDDDNQLADDSRGDFDDSNESTQDC